MEQKALQVVELWLEERSWVWDSAGSGWNWNSSSPLLSTLSSPDIPFLLLSLLLLFSSTGGVHSSIRGSGPGGGTASAGGHLGISEDSADGGRGTGGPGNCRGLFC